MSKIGILTFHCAHNYGAVLQAYALSTYLKLQGYDVEIIDYQPKSIVNAHGVFPTARFRGLGKRDSLKLLFKLLTHAWIRATRAKKFRRFIASLPLSATQPSSADTSSLSNYDTIICGSDQVWNPVITNGFNYLYIGEFPFAGRKISYAASTQLNDSDSAGIIATYGHIAANFDAISVREHEIAEFLRRQFDADVTEVVDPVFLLSPQQWREMAVIPEMRNKYLLLYQVRSDERVTRMAQEYARNHGLDFIEITAEAEFPKARFRLQTLSPEEFVGYFSEASAVVTTSFHGSAFATLFEKPFTTITFGDGSDTRAANLLKRFGITAGFTPVDSPHIAELHTARFNLNDATESSRKFLQKNLSR